MLEVAGVAAAEDLRAFFASLHACRDKSALTHGLHPYPAKFIPHIPRALIRSLTEPDHAVWDPMCGSGTTLVEATITSRQAIGSDLNPIAVLVSRAKTGALTQSARDELRTLIEWLGSRRPGQGNTPPPTFHNRDKWFQPHVLAELADSKAACARLNDERAQTLALASFSAILVGVSNQESETRWCAKPKDIPLGEVYRRLCSKLNAALRMAQEYALASGGAEARVFEADARHAGLPSSSVDAVITSPPYANSHDYYLYNKLRIFWLGRDVAPVQAAEIGSRNRHSDRKEPIDTYIGEMAEVFREVARVLRPGGRSAFVVADAVVRGERHDMGAIVGGLGVGAGLDLVERHSFDHRQFNTSFQRGFGTRRHKLTHVLIHRSQ